MSVTEHLEIERKYDVDADTPIPDLTVIPGVVRTAGPTEYDLDAVYFDTAELSLATYGITLRRRTGDDDSGWHLKLPVGQDRREIRVPLGRAVKTPPAVLRRAVRIYTRGARLRPVATIRTRRLVTALIAEDGGTAAEFCDDHVGSELAGTGLEPQSWREWEVEVVDADAAILDAAESVVLAAGAARGDHSSKLSRVLAHLMPEEPTPAMASAGGPAVDVAVAYITTQREEIVRLDPAFRAEEADAVHDMRVAVRRLRSCLATYRKLFDVDVVTDLRHELRWLGGALGEARDAEVLQAQVRRAIGREPADSVVGPIAARLDDDLDTAYREGRRAALAVLDGQRYIDLLDTIDQLTSSPPVSDLGTLPARDVVPALIHHDWRRLTKAVGRADAAASAADRDVELHEARKAAKRVRYAAESAEPIFGKRARRLVKTAKRIQTILGDHHDTVVERELLRRVGREAHLAGEDTFTFGRLDALAEVRADELDRRWRHEWSRISKPKTGRWS